MSLIDSLKHMVVEDDEPSAPTKQTPHATTKSTTPVATPAPATIPSFSSFASSAAPPAPPQGSEDFYQYLLEHYDFDKTPIGVTLQEGVTSLAAVPMDEATRLKAAVAIAKTKGVTEDAVIGVFDTLKQQIATAEATAKQQIDAFSQKEVTARQNRLTEVQTQIANLQAEQTKLGGELANAQATVTQKQTSVAIAVQRRNTEIDQQKSKIATLLKG